MLAVPDLSPAVAVSMPIERLVLSTAPGANSENKPPLVVTPPVAFSMLASRLSEKLSFGTSLAIERSCQAPDHRRGNCQSLSAPVYGWSGWPADARPRRFRVPDPPRYRSC